MNDTTASLAAFALGAAAAAPSVQAGEGHTSIVLVHGAFVDGSGWAGVHRILRDDGFDVVVVQHPTASLADDVAITRRAIAAAKGDVVLVGHSYGGVVITEAGVDAKVKSLVYIAAFAPDKDESVASLLANSPPDAPSPPILPSADGFLLLDKTKFHAAFAADVAPDIARVMADSQLPWGTAAFAGSISVAAWKSKPSWYLVAQDDKMIPSDAQRAMAVRIGAKTQSLPGSHAVYIANPVATAALIKEAASAGK
jgi:pimeloyl-ACP methyl ester carboxylesterase